MSDQSLTVIPPEQGEVAASEQLSAGTVLDMMRGIVKGGVTPENAISLEKMVSLLERVQDRHDKRQGIAAFGRLQSRVKVVKATKPVPNNDGTVRYTFAPFEEIMEQIQPHLDAEGFTVSFSTRYEEGRMVKVCILQHSASGWEKSNEFSVRVGSGPPKATETQADGAASTYAKRFALCDALNIVIEKDSDARLEGSPITEEQAKELHQRVMDTESDHKAFLKFCGVPVQGSPTFEDYKRIMSSRYPAADEMLRKKEARGR